MKYKVGDKVRVREDLEVGKYYGCYLNKEMAELKGKVVEIEDIDSGSYFIKENNSYYWTEEMFSGLAKPEPKPKNLIPLIAKELGVEIGEEFNIVKGFYNPYRFSETDLLDRDGSIALNSLRRLLNGELNIEKLPPKPKLTEDEKAILRNIPKIYKYIARDGCGELYVYDNKPKKDFGVWVMDRFGSDYFNNLNLFQHLFQFIKWEDNKPYKHLFQFIKWEDKDPYNIEELLEE